VRWDVHWQKKAFVAALTTVRLTPTVRLATWSPLCRFGGQGGATNV